LVSPAPAGRLANYRLANCHPRRRAVTGLSTNGCLKKLSH